MAVTPLAALTWTEARDALARGPLLLLPVGATEPHGPHLPLDTDVRLSEGLAARAAEALAAVGYPSLLLPSLAYTVTGFGRPFPGNISLRPETLAATLGELWESLSGSGARALVFLNSHLELDHVKVLRQAAEALTTRGGLPVLFPDPTRRRWVGTLSAEFQSGSCHAGRYETSLLLAHTPEVVRPHHDLPEVFVDLAQAMRAGAHTFVEAGAVDAYCGAPAEASAAEGEILYGRLVEMVVATVEEAAAAGQISPATLASGGPRGR